MASVGLPSVPRAHVSARALLFLALIGALVVFYFDTFQSMWAVYLGGETYTHGMFMPLVSLWLVWRRRMALSATPIRVAPLGVIALLACGVVWMIGELAGVNALQHFGVVAMVPSLVLLVFGWAVVRQLAFPLSFLYFAVPFGDFLMPWLIDRTADFTVAAVQLSGVPVLREGRHFVLPTGSWSVVEACSGLRYLLAAVPLGCLYAYLSYRSNRTRGLYIAAVIAIAIVANWLRAYLIVMLGHLSAMTIATGVDHLIYGWLFFGIVMGIAFWAGSYLPDFPVRSVRIEPSSSASSQWRVGEPGFRLPAFALTALLSMAAWPAVADRLLDMGSAAYPLDRVARELTVASNSESDYLPGYDGGVATALGRSRADATVNVLTVQYLHQHRNGEMVGAGHGVRPLDRSRSGWQVMNETVFSASALAPGGLPGVVNEYQIALGDRRVLVWEWFWVNRRTVNSARQVKIETASALLTGKGDESLVWVLWTPLVGDLEATRLRLVNESTRLSAATAVPTH